MSFDEHSLPHGPRVWVACIMAVVSILNFNALSLAPNEYHEKEFMHNKSFKFFNAHPINQERLWGVRVLAVP